MPAGRRRPRQHARQPSPHPAPQPAPARPSPSAQRQRQAYKPRRRFPSILLERPIYMAGALAALVAVIALVTFSTTRGGGSSPSTHAAVCDGRQRDRPRARRARLGDAGQGELGLAHHAQGQPACRTWTNGRYYQAWLKNSAGILVPIGTFNDAVNVTLWSGVPVTQFQTLTVTRQQANGNPASSGQRVLTGTITKSP